MQICQSLLPLASATIYNAERTAKASERAALVAQLRAEHPTLLTPSDELRSLNCAAKNIRTELKAAFPGHKFSVQIASFSMGNSISVSWIDGPADSRVAAIVDRYQYGSFNGMEDLYEYNHSLWCEAFGGTKWAKTSRDYSPQVYAWAKEEADRENKRSLWDAEIWRVLQNLSIKAIKKAEA